MTKQREAFTAADAAEIAARRAAGETLDEIAARLGRHRGTIWRFLKRGLDTTRRHQRDMAPAKTAALRARSASASLRPSHVKGEAWSEDWYASQQAAFAAAMHAEINSCSDSEVRDGNSADG